jgi:hypothetical protein
MVDAMRSNVSRLENPLALLCRLLLVVIPAIGLSARGDGQEIANDSEAKKAERLEFAVAGGGSPEKGLEGQALRGAEVEGQALRGAAVMIFIRLPG